MKFRVRVGDLVRYKIGYVHSHRKEKQTGLVLRKLKAGAGMTELNILWNTGQITQTSLHMVRKYVKV